MTTTEDGAPPRVTRFYGNVEFAMDVVHNAQVALVHVSLLNDPFDPYCFFETDFRDSYQNLMAYVRKHHHDDMPWFRAQVTAQSLGQTIISLKAFLRRIAEESFVLCASAPRPDFHPQENLYMWGHYADGHRGLAIEFDTQALADAARKHNDKVNERPIKEQKLWAKIEYAKSFSPITAEHVYEFFKQEAALQKTKTARRKDTELDRYYSRMTVIKSEVWQPENEWRLMWSNSDKAAKVYKFPIKKDAITSVYFGLELRADKAEMLSVAAKSNFPTASLFRARRKHGDFALEFDQL